jgi:uncharacterized protein (DUF433 family)
VSDSSARRAGDHAHGCCDRHEVARLGLTLATHALCGPRDGVGRCWQEYRDRVSRLERITSDSAICHGQPTIRGLRYTVESVLELLSAGMTVDDVLADYADLERDDILAALEFGARAVGGRVVPLTAA